MDYAFVFNMMLGIYIVSVWILGWIINYNDVKIQSWVELQKEVTMEDFLVRGNRFTSFSKYKLNELPAEMHSYAKKHASAWRTITILTVAFLIFAFCMLFSLH